MYSYENTYNEKTGEWHPHIHIFALVDSWIDQQEFAEYWHSITGDSYIVDVRRAKKEKGTGYAAAAEVCKYALKFGDLSVEHTWEAFKILKGRRLTGSFGLLWGVKIPEKPQMIYQTINLCLTWKCFINSITASIHTMT